MVQQNLSIALALSVLAGLSQILVVFIVAYPKYYVNVLGNQISPCLQKMILPSSILLNVISSVFCIGGSALFGPVAIIAPTRLASQLLFNMIMFSVVTKMETFDKSTRVGTYIVTLGVIMLPIVGPTTQEQDAIELLTRPFSMAWSIFLFAVICAACVVNTFFVAPDKITGTPAAVSMLSANVFGAVFAISVFKAMGTITGWQSAIVWVLTICAFAVVAHSTILQATRIDQKVFVPAVTCGNQILNAVTGLIIWQDWKVVQSWTGYVVVMMIILLGVYLTSTYNNEDHSVDRSASVVTKSMLVGNRRPDPVVSDIGESDKHEVSSKAYRRLSSNLSGKDVNLGKIHALEIGYGDTDDNDKDLPRHRRGNASRGSSLKSLGDSTRYMSASSLKSIGDSIRRMSLNSIGGSSRRIEVHDANENESITSKGKKSDTNERKINCEELVSPEDDLPKLECSSLVSKIENPQCYDAVSGKHIEASTEDFEGLKSSSALANNLRSVIR